MNSATGAAGRGWTIYRVAVAGVLLTAAGLKAWSPATGVDAVLLPMAEAALAAWLLAGCWPTACRAVVVLMFSAFAGYAAHLWQTGQGSCGCFGVVTVPPAATAAGDAAIVVLGCLVTPGEPDRRRGWRMAAAGALGVAAAVIAAGSVFVETPAPGVTVAGDTVALDPTAWAGRDLPILADLGSDGARLAVGEHLLVLSRADCSACGELYRRLPGPGEPAITPIAVDGQGDVTLDRARRYRVGTPTVLHVRDGRVLAAALGVDPGLALIRRARRNAAAPPGPSAAAAPR